MYKPIQRANQVHKKTLPLEEESESLLELLELLDLLAVGPLLLFCSGTEVANCSLAIKSVHKKSYSSSITSS
jgi:hypothetical protein